MEVFISFVKQRHILEDFKNTFDTSSKFKYPEPSEQQKRKFFDEEFNQIISKFYVYLKTQGAFDANPNKQYGEGSKEIDQSTIIVQFDTWLELDQNVFTHVEKPKANTPQTVYSYSVNNVTQINNNKYNTPSQPPKNTETKQFLAQKQLQSPASKPIGPIAPHVAMYTPSSSNHPHPTPHQPQTYHQPQTSHQPPTPHQAPTPHQQATHHHHQPPTPHQYHKQAIFHVVAAQQRVEQKQKPYRLRFIQKLSQFLDCPQRYTITKSEISSLTSGRK